MIDIRPALHVSEILPLNRDAQDLHYALYPKEFKPFREDAIRTALEDMLARSGTYAYVALEDGIPIGYILCKVEHSPENAFRHARTVLYIDQLSVVPSHRKKGVGSLLINQAEELAASLDISALILDHWDNNRSAGKFFTGNGFQYTGHRMRKDLI